MNEETNKQGSLSYPDEEKEESLSHPEIKF